MSVEELVGVLMKEYEALNKVVEDYELSIKRRDHNMQNKLVRTFEQAKEELTKMLAGDRGRTDERKKP